MAKKHTRAKSPPRTEPVASDGPGAAKPAGSLAPHLAPNARSRAGVEWALLVGALVLAGLHLWLRVQPVLRYQLGVPAFFVDAPFYAKLTGVSGGLLQYAAAALAQLNFHNATGALALTAVWAGLLFGSRFVFRQVSPRGATAGTLVWLALLAALPGRYQGEVETAALGMLAAVASASAWLALPRRFDGLRLSALGVLAVAVFYFAGAFPTWLFTATVAVAELAGRRRPGFALGCAAPALLVPFWIWYRPGFDPLAAARHWGTGLTWALFAAAYGFVPLWLALQAAAPMVRLRFARGQAKATLPPRHWTAWLVGAAAGVALIWGTLDPSPRARAWLDRSVARHEWDRALAAAKGIRVWTASARLNLTRALYHAGRLPEDVFSYPQSRGLDLLPGFEAGLEMSRALSQTLFELGEVNLAEHLAHEALEIEGPRPDTLRLLARINVLKDRPEAARILLNRLRLAPFHGVEAGFALQALAADPRGANDAELRLIRGRLPTTDLASGSVPTEMLLQHLLAANPTNRMAYAYLLTHRLLNGELEPLLQDLALRAAFGYTAMPRPCAEAVLLHQRQSGDGQAAPHGFPVSPAIVERYQRFAASSQRYRENPAAGRRALAAEFGDTFWYYLVFGRSPRTDGSRPGEP